VPKPLSGLSLSSLILVVFVTCVPFSARGRAAELGDLIERVPASASALIIVEAKSFFESPLAREKGWQEEVRDAFATAPFLLPPDATRVVVGSELNLATMAPYWEMAQLTFDAAPSESDVAKLAGGRWESLAERNVLHTPLNAYMLPLDRQTWGVYSPADRQALGRWLRSLDADARLASDYLRDTIAAHQAGRAQILAALSLQDVIAEDRVRDHLRSCQTLKEREVNIDEMAKFLAGIRGISLRVAVDERIRGQLAMDFRQPATPLADLGKPLLIEMLDHLGAAINEIDTWQPQIQESRFVLQGDLSAEGLRRILTVFLTRSSSHHAKLLVTSEDKSTAPAPDTTPQDRMATTTGRYFRSIESVLQGLEFQGQTDDAMALTLWVDTYAGRIEGLPTRNVDPEAIAFGQWLAKTLREWIATVQGVDGTIQRELAKNIPDFKVTVGAWDGGGRGRWRRPSGGGWRVQFNPGAALRTRNQIVDRAQQDAMDRLTSIRDEILKKTAATRASLAKKYPDHISAP
jgi:hypothetical protein